MSIDAAQLPREARRFIEDVQRHFLEANMPKMTFGQKAVYFANAVVTEVPSPGNQHWSGACELLGPATQQNFEEVAAEWPPRVQAEASEHLNREDASATVLITLIKTEVDGLLHMKTDEFLVQPASQGVRPRQRRQNQRRR